MQLMVLIKQNPARLAIRGSFKNMLEERNFQIMTLKGEKKDHLVGGGPKARPQRMVEHSEEEIKIGLQAYKPYLLNKL